MAHDLRPLEAGAVDHVPACEPPGLCAEQRRAA
jgi:hypothetical protein